MISKVDNFVSSLFFVDYYKAWSYYYYYYYTPWKFFKPTLADTSFIGVCVTANIQRWSLLNILAVLNNAAVWMVSIRHPIFKSSIPFTKSLWAVPSAPIRTDITVTFMFHSFFCSLARSLFFLFLIFTHWSAWTAKTTIRQVLFSFLLIITRSGFLAEIRYFVCISEFQTIFCISFSRKKSGLSSKHLLV